MNNTTLTWLGQSGFLLEAAGVRLACDLYLSDYCKLRSKLDHTRLTPIPVEPHNLPPIRHYLITHAHIDHFDPLTVGPILRTQPDTVFYCPPSGEKVIAEFFPAQRERFRLIDTQEAIRLQPGVRLIALPAAHEELEKDAGGEYLAFSYLVLLEEEKQAVLFAGDTIPYPGQSDRIRAALPAGYALTLVLPVNGRDEPRAKLGFKGNLTLAEAIRLYQETGADQLVPCHFGMFALNDIPHPLTADCFAGLCGNVSIPVILKPIVCGAMV